MKAIVEKWGKKWHRRDVAKDRTSVKNCQWNKTTGCQGDIK